MLLLCGLFLDVIVVGDDLVVVGVIVVLKCVLVYVFFDVQVMGFDGMMFVDVCEFCLMIVVQLFDEFVCEVVEVLICCMDEFDVLYVLSWVVFSLCVVEFMFVDY